MRYWKRAVALFLLAVLCGVVGFIAYFAQIPVLPWVAFALALLALAGAVLALVDKIDIDEGLSAPDADQGKTGFVDPNEIPAEQQDAPGATGDPRRAGNEQADESPRGQ